MSASAALKKKPSEGGEKAAKAAGQASAPEAQEGMPAYLGGIAGGSGAPAFLQRAPLDSAPADEIDDLGPEATIQRLPQDPFPSAEDEEEAEDPAISSVQAKLEINTPGDAYEREADRVADAVTSGGSVTPAAPAVQGGGTPSVQRKCDACGKQGEEGGTCPDCGGKVQRKEAGSVNAPKPTTSVAQAVAQPDSGQPIPDRTRTPIEAELGQDLSHVRVHQGEDASQAATSIGAKAFTHGDHIWLGPGQSADNTALMAHEATHTVQQGSGRSGPSLVQRAPADHQHPEDGTAPKARIEGELEQEKEDRGERDEDEPIPEIDPAEKRAKSGPLVSQAKPDTDRPAQESPKVEQAANDVKQEADSPTETLVEGQREEPDAEGSETEEPPEVADPVGDAVAQVAALPEPEAPRAVEAPPIAQPVDGDGQALPPEAQGEAMVQAVAAQLQVSREAAYGLRRKAKQQRANAIVLRGNLALADQHIGEAESGLTTAHSHMEVRRDVLSEADNAHTTSEQKAETVAQDAPGIEAEADEAEGESGPMASESSDSAAQAQANKPDDPDAAADAEASSGEMNSVSGDAASMNQASGATKQRAVQLQQDAAEAKQQNADAKAKIEGAKASADQTDAKLVEMDGQSSQARGELEPLGGTPDTAEAEAQRLDAAALQADGRVDTMAQQLLSVQQKYVADMGRVPGSETLAEENEGQIQRTEDAAAPAEGVSEAAPAMAPRGYEGRAKVDLPTFQMGPPLTDEQREKRAAAAARAEETRRARIQAIQDGAHGNFSEMDGLDKAGLALDFMLEDTFAKASNIKWPDFSAASVGKALLNIIDPRGPLNGIMGGLSKVASGGLNLFDMDQWARDPLGNLLKSAADIATGITVVLGSIVALLGVVVAISAALIVLSWFTLAPALTPVIAWCTSAGITVGGWTISVGLLALYYQSLLVIKNIVDVMTAETAEELVQNTEQLGDDFSQVGEIGMQMGTAYLGAKGGPGMMDDIATNGIRTVARQEVMEGLKDAALEVAVGEDISGVVGMARMAHGVHSHATGGGGGGAARADDGTAPRPTDTDSAPPAADAGSDVRPAADAPDVSTPRDDGSASPPDAPAQDAPTPNNQLQPADGPSPNLVEGDSPQPSRDMDTAPPEAPQPQADASGDSNASARSDEAGADAPPAAEPTVDGGGAVDRPDTNTQIPQADADGGGRQQGEDAGPSPDGDGPSQRPSEADAATPDADAGGNRPQDGADPNAPRAHGENPAALRESAGQKRLDEMSPAERRAEAEQANAAPREDIDNPALRDAGFDDVAHLDNGMDYVRSSEEGAACRIANSGCGPTDGDGTIPPKGLTGDPAVEAKVDAALAAGDGEGGSNTPQNTPDANPEAPRPDADVEADADTTNTDTTADGADPKPETDAEGTRQDGDDLQVKSQEEQVRETADGIEAMIRDGNEDALVTHLEALGYTVVREGGGTSGKIVRVDRPRGRTNTLPLVRVQGGNIARVDGTTPRSRNFDTENMSDFTKRYLEETGGRWGSKETREQNYEIAKSLQDQDYSFPDDAPGGGLGREEYIKGDSETGGTYVDITAIDPEGNTVRIQTVDTVDGTTMTDRERANADRILKMRPDDKLLIVPKNGKFPDDAVEWGPKEEQ